MKAFNYTITLFPGQDEYDNLYTAGNVIFTRQEEGRRTNVMVKVDGMSEYVGIWYGQDGEKYSIDEICNHLKININWLTEK
jgi:hypothetical protein